MCPVDDQQLVQTHVYVFLLILVVDVDVEADEVLECIVDSADVVFCVFVLLSEVVVFNVERSSFFFEQF